MNGFPVEPRLTEYLYRKASAAGVPLSGTFELTPLCNMDCKMCYIRLSRQQQEAIAPLHSLEQWLELAWEAKDAGMLYLLLTGGEPFTFPGFPKLLEELHKMGLLITINSNGTQIDEKTITWLKKCPPTRINVSLYGASDEAYDRLCGNPRGFTQTDKAIRLLQEAGIPVKLSCSLTPQNARELPGIMAYANSRKLVAQPSAYMFPPVRRDPAAVGQMPDSPRRKLPTIRHWRSITPLAGNGFWLPTNPAILPLNRRMAAARQVTAFAAVRANAAFGSPGRVI